LLAGSTISFDRAFAVRAFPKTLDLLHYRNLDISTIRSFCKIWHPEVYEGSPYAICKSDNIEPKHRALDDIRFSIEEMRYFRKHLTK
jgi:oligoribonuclease